MMLFVAIERTAYSQPGNRDASPINFAQDIKPILANNCYTCHGPDEETREAGLRLDSFEGATDSTSGYPAIVPFNLDESELIERIESDDESFVMPPADHGSRLSDQEIELLKAWIQSGAQYQPHWAYLAPQRPVIPSPVTGPQETFLAQWPRNNIDLFVLDKMLSHQLTPEPEADRLTLARRVAIDLTGLPPTVEQADRFATDPSADAYERYVDQLLDSDAYAEHWAAMWLDMARYADTAGYAEDHPRTIWAYRDYVIRSFQKNQTFDQFTIEQIAGDLLPNPTTEQLIATAFHRNTLTNSEGGTDDEEFRSAAVVDRTNTTMAVWMGTTMACAQCHTHKYDPITHHEYFQFYALLNNTADNDQPNESPVINLFNEQQLAQREALQIKIEELQNELPEDPSLKKELESKLAELNQALLEMVPETTVPVMVELEKPRETFIQLRGNYLQTGDQVWPGTPAAFHPLRSESRDENNHPDRLDLAKWLVDRNNPLTARVVVNRYWERLFGTGIVRTSEDFGIQGDLPTHPELLDYLAIEFMDRGWDNRSIIKEMVMSATYRQRSVVSAEKEERDAANVWLSRGPRVRISAETVRDQALFVSGLLSPKMFGPPVQPPAPKLGLSRAFAGAIDWTTSVGEDRYRRAIYTQWRRSSPYPSLETFDMSNREVCDLRRINTNSPLQALVTLNDEVYVEAAQGLAWQLAHESAETAEIAKAGFRQVLIRHPSEEELEALVELYKHSVQHFSDFPDQARKLAGQRAQTSSDQDAIRIAGWTTVANVLLNLDEVFQKP